MSNNIDYNENLLSLLDSDPIQQQNSSTSSKGKKLKEMENDMRQTSIQIEHEKREPKQFKGLAANQEFFWKLDMHCQVKDNQTAKE